MPRDERTKELLRELAKLNPGRPSGGTLEESLEFRATSVPSRITVIPSEAKNLCSLLGRSEAVNLPKVLRLRERGLGHGGLAKPFSIVARVTIIA